MTALRAIPLLDPQPILDLIEEKGGSCTFDEALDALVQRRFPLSAARDALWRFLSDGRIEFTPDRQLTVPHPDVPERTER